MSVPTVLLQSYSLTLSGASEPLLAQNMNRSKVILSNVAATGTVWVNLIGGTAEANGTDCIPIAVGQTIILDTGSACPGNAMTVFGTASDPFTCLAS